jgi:membrane dipeptidase
MTDTQIPVIDSHLDLALNALHLNRNLRQELDRLNEQERGMRDHQMREKATITLPELRDAGVVVCVATVLARYSPGYRPANGYSRMDIDFATPDIANADAVGQFAYYEALERAGEIILLRSAREVRQHVAGSPIGKGDEKTAAEEVAAAPIGVILGMEGSDPILSAEDAEVWFRRGLRVASLCHYGKGIFAAGTGTPGPLTKAGSELLATFRGLGIILDLSHLAEQAFFEAMETFDGPVMASHNNCRALVPGDRQFSDEQIRAILKRDGIIGTAFDAWMLHKRWVRGQTQPTELDSSAVVDHLDHICTLAGDSRHAALGTDLDGGFGSEQTPGDVKRYSGIHRLREILKDRGYCPEDIENIFWRNWHDFFVTHLPG